jgi:carotenoid cleavage dioxygenase-like enzyme
VLNVATKIGSSVVLSLYEHGPSERARRVLASFRSKRVPYTHSFGLTPQHAILIVHPFTASPLEMLWSNRGYIDHFAWRPSEGTHLVVMERATGHTHEHRCDPFFVFHTVNAFERGDETVLDVLAYDNADIIEMLRVDHLAAHLPDLRPSLVRVRMQRGVREANVEKLSDQGFEFPATSYRRANGQDYRFVWGAANAPGAPEAYGSSILKVDVHTGASTSFSEPSMIFGEPVFVARPGASDEDDGVLVSVGSRSDVDRSALVVLDARTMESLARAEVPCAIPLGFHGSFVRSRDAQPQS